MHAHDFQPTLADIVERIATQGYAVIPRFLPPTICRRLESEAIAMRDAGQLHRAGIGKGAETSVNDRLRGDFIGWLDASACGPETARYLGTLEALRQEVNRSLYLGLQDFEGHVAIYPPGGFYRKHLDRFRNDSRRTLTCILYLNEDWQEEDGGMLRLYLDANGTGPYLDIAPQAGTLVAFLSERFWHEVLPAQRERLSITGWFRTRGDNVL